MDMYKMIKYKKTMYRIYLRCLMGRIYQMDTINNHWIYVSGIVDYTTPLFNICLGDKLLVP
jgi:hypothetical protein